MRRVGRGQRGGDARRGGGERRCAALLATQAALRRDAFGEGEAPPRDRQR